MKHRFQTIFIISFIISTSLLLGSSLSPLSNMQLAPSSLFIGTQNLELPEVPTEQELAFDNFYTSFMELAQTLGNENLTTVNATTYEVLKERFLENYQVFIPFQEDIPLRLALFQINMFFDTLDKLIANEPVSEQDVADLESLFDFINENFLIPNGYYVNFKAKNRRLNIQGGPIERKAAHQMVKQVTTEENEVNDVVQIIDTFYVKTRGENSIRKTAELLAALQKSGQVIIFIDENDQDLQRIERTMNRSADLQSIAQPLINAQWGETLNFDLIRAQLQLSSEAHELRHSYDDFLNLTPSLKAAAKNKLEGKAYFELSAFLSEMVNGSLPYWIVLRSILFTQDFFKNLQRKRPITEHQFASHLLMERLTKDLNIINEDARLTAPVFQRNLGRIVDSLMEKDQEWLKNWGSQYFRQFIMGTTSERHHVHTGTLNAIQSRSQLLQRRDLLSKLTPRNILNRQNWETLKQTFNEQNSDLSWMDEWRNWLLNGRQGTFTNRENFQEQFNTFFSGVLTISDDLTSIRNILFSPNFEEIFQQNFLRDDILSYLQASA